MNKSVKVENVHIESSCKNLQCILFVFITVSAFGSNESMINVLMPTLVLSKDKGTIGVMVR